MDDVIKMKIDKAKQDQDLSAMERIYRKNRENELVILEYAKMLSKENAEKAKKFFNKLSRGGRYQDFAIFQLGKIEQSLGNMNLAEEYYNLILNTKYGLFAKYELGRINIQNGNYDVARKLFDGLLGTKNNNYALLELGRLEAKLQNYDKARHYLEPLCNLEDKDKVKYAESLLLLIEYKYGDKLKAFKRVKKVLASGIEVEPNILIAISKDLNIFFDYDYTKINYNYELNQLIDYDPFLAIDYIVDNNEFAKNINVQKLFNECEKKLNEQNNSHDVIFNDRYNVTYNDQNYAVITLPNQQKILRIYPS